MLRFDERQRAVLVEKVPDLANIAAGTLVFGQVVAGGEWSWTAMLGGIGMWLVLIAFTLFVARKKRYER